MSHVLQKMDMSRLTILALVISLASLGAPSTTPIGTTAGIVNGVALDGVTVYKGIPYAAPPTGPLRWKAPQPATKWEGVRDASEFGPMCPQTGYPQGSIYYSPPEKQSEDCLSLNIWAPAAAPNEHRPVMVWIHGGGFTRGTGSTPTYDGGSLARKGVVVVTINYRLGALGFLAHPELTAESENKSSGNYALLDQIEALRWVKQNIAAFGGDPNRVTIFGESAGSWAVNCLVATPLARGLFHRAIGESGGSFGPMSRLDASEKAGVAFGKAVGAESLEALRALPPEKILDQQESSRISPNVDGWVLPDEVRAIFAAGKHNDVPVLIGSNANEMTTLAVPAAIPVTIEAYRKQVAPVYGSHMEEVDALYPATTNEQAVQAYLSELRDITFTLPMRTWARATAKGKSSAYLYFFSHVPPNRNSKYLGAYHAGEIIYVFNNLAMRPQTAWGASDRELASQMSSYWVNFATSGDPNGQGLAVWKPYKRDSEYYMDLGDQPKLKQHLERDRLDFTERMGLIRRR